MYKVGEKLMILVKIKDDNRIEFGKTAFAIHDISPSRFLQHNQNGMFIISAMKEPIPVNKKYSEFTPEEKENLRIGLERTKQLQNDVRAEGLGYISTLGGYPVHKGPEETYDVNEYSIIVPRNPKIFDEEEFVEFAMELCKKYNQDAILISGISFIDNGQARYLQPGDETKYTIDPDFQFENVHVNKEFDPQKRPYYTRLKKASKETFTYDSESEKYLGKYFATRAPRGWAANCAAAQKGELLLDWWN